MAFKPVGIDENSFFPVRVETRLTAKDTANRNRANHTGTQSADTVVDGTANKVYTAAEKTKLAAFPSTFDWSALVNKPAYIAAGSTAAAARAVIGAITAADLISTNITDATALGKQVLTAPDQATAAAILDVPTNMDLSGISDLDNQYADMQDAAQLALILNLLGRPQKVMNLLVTSTTGVTASLQWDALTVTPTGYKVYRGSTLAATLTSGTLANTYTDSGLTGDTVYTYTVVAYNGTGDTVPSAPAEAHTQPVTSSVPSAPVAAPGGSSATTITTIWTASTAPAGDPVLGYHIYRDGSGTALTSVASNVLTVTDSGLTAGDSHSYTITAYNNAGESALSNSVTSTASDNTSPVRGTFTTAPDNASVTSRTVNLPTGIQDGDAGYIIVGSNLSTNTLPTVPTGWTLADSQTSANKSSWLLTKAMASTDTSVTVTLGTSSRFCFGGVVMARSLQAPNASVPYSDSTEDLVLDLPAITPTVSDTTEIALTFTRYSVLGTNGVSAWPTGFTEKQDTVSTQTTTPLVGIAIATKPLPGAASAKAATTATYLQNTQENGWLITSAPNLSLPTAPTLTETSKTDVQIALAWSGATAPSGDPILGYYVYRGGVLVQTVNSGTSYTDTGLTASTSYAYTVRAFNNAGTGAASSTLTITTNPAQSSRFPGDPGAGNMYLGTTEGIESISALDQDIYGTVPTKRHILVRVYNPSTQQHPDDFNLNSGQKADLTAHCNAGRIPLYSFKKGPYSFTDITAGTADTDLNDLGSFFATIPGKVWINFWHEPEDNIQTVTDQQNYRAAFRYIVNYFYNNYTGTRNRLAWTTILQGFRFSASNTAFRAWHPNWNNAGTAWLTNGPFNGSYVHMDGCDRYNPLGPSKYGSFTSATRMTTWASNIGDYLNAWTLAASGSDPGNVSQQRPHVIGEYGTYTTPLTIDDDVSAAQIFNAMVTTGAASGFVGVSQFNSKQCAMGTFSGTNYDPNRVRRIAWKAAIDNHSNVIMLAGS